MPYETGFEITNVVQHAKKPTHIQAHLVFADT